MMRLPLLAVLAAGLHACASAPPPPPADRVFFGEHILSVDPATRDASAVALRGDRIVAVGGRSAISPFVGEDTVVTELGERALVPGFIDAHGHLALVMSFLSLANVSSPPVGPARTIDDVVAVLRGHLDQKQLPPGAWVIGYGYDDSLLAERRHPTRDDLDRVSSEHPVAILHVSGHIAAVSSLALAVSGMDATTEDPPGGVIRRRPGSREPDGILEEAAAGAVLFARLAEGAAERFPAELAAALDHHAAFGITTVQDGASSPEFVAGVRAIAAARPLPIDVAAFPHVNAAPDDVPLDTLGYAPSYENGFRVAGAKFVLDGSPQGRTAWLTEPYAEGPPGAGADYAGYPIVDPAHYRALAARLIAAGIPFLAHANGDAAIDLMLDGVAGAIGESRPDHRSVAIHAQLTRADQIERMKELGVVPSYFAAHPFFWGDWHRRSFGDARALRISPLASSLAAGLPFTIHNDAPVVPPDVLRLIQIAVTRTTRSGFVLGANERLSVEQALQAVTLGAAYQYFEEDEKGSITPGKRADLVVLGADPREVAPDRIAEIAVVETICRGRTVYDAAP